MQCCTTHLYIDIDDTVIAQPESPFFVPDAYKIENTTVPL